MVEVERLGWDGGERTNAGTRRWDRREPGPHTWRRSYGTTWRLEGLYLKGREVGKRHRLRGVDESGRTDC